MFNCQKVFLQEINFNLLTDDISKKNKLIFPNKKIKIKKALKQFEKIEIIFLMLIQMLLKLNLKKIGFHIDQTSKVVVIVFLDILKLFL
jgi:hypothetical protein